MGNFTISDLSPLYSGNAAGTQANRAPGNGNDTVSIHGDLNDNELIVSLRSPSSGRTLREQRCARIGQGDLPNISEAPHRANGFCDISKGETSEGLRVVIESYRCYTDDSQHSSSLPEIFYRHAFICNSLSHANIIPFLGIFSSPVFPYACIFESVGKGNLAQHLAGSPSASRVQLLVEVARGLHHIHDLGVVHGNIRSTNIRIDDQGTARIAGFASATIILQPDIALEDIDGPDVSRWSSPEILHPGGSGFSKARVTKASDMYAFGMLAYEVFAGQVPFHDRTDPEAVIIVITTDERPPRPTHKELSGQLWELIQRCWQKNPLQRPTIREVVHILERSRP